VNSAVQQVDSPHAKPTLVAERAAGGALTLRAGGSWNLHRPTPEFEAIASHLETDPRPVTVAFEMGQLQGYDSSLISVLVQIAKCCQQKQLPLEVNGLPEGVRGLLKLALAVPEKKTGGRYSQESFFTRVGTAGLDVWGTALDAFAFLGEILLSVGRWVRGRAVFRWSDTWLIVQRCGAEALPIVTLINLLVGVIIGFVGAVQLEKFGASIYMADLVGIAMVRELGCIMTGIIMSGRTGASFAAEIGSMKVTQEIDALKTLGFSPMDFLVLPRVLALVLMLPLLTAYGNVMGMIGGALVAPAFDITWSQYLQQILAAVDLPNYAAGILKSVVFGVIVAGAGCLKGMQSGNSSSAVGLATTSAVVTAITAIIGLDAVFAFLLTALGI